MTRSSIPELALGKLRAAKIAAQERPDTREVLGAKDEVLARYSPVFQPGQIENIDEDVLRSFLYLENNRHWSGLARQVNRICADMSATRKALAQLVDESQPLAKRTQPVIEIKGMGRGIVTAILHVAFPDRYGVWNRTSHDGLEALGLMPQFPWGTSFGERYDALNKVLLQLAQELDVDLWTLDTLWWCLTTGSEVADPGPVEASTSESSADTEKLSAAKSARFALERHLQDYMFDNWDQLDLAKDWAIYTQDGEPDAGYEFRTPIGRIDLLARHRHDGSWLVIELKREKSSDAVIGQVLRYMGWVKRHLAQGGEKVQGLVVATQGDSQLHYALEVVPMVSFKSYQVEFRLRDGPTFEEFAKP